MMTHPRPTGDATRPADAFELRPMASDDCDATADLHVRYLGDGLFPRLGRGFVRRWRAPTRRTCGASGHVAVRPDGEVLGFVTAASDQRAYVMCTVRTARASLISRGALAMLVRPPVAAHFLRTRVTSYWARLRRPVQSAPPGPRTAVVHAIVTVPESRGTGVGRRLLVAIETDVRAAGTERIELLSEDGENGGADFYRRLGWTEGTTFVNRDDRTMVRFSRHVVDG